MARTIVITGASSGIGKGLALQYAREGNALALSGRNHERLAAVAGECARLGASAMAEVIDVCDRSAMEQWLTGLDRLTPIDLVVANAGLMAGTPPSGGIESADDAYETFATNTLGVLNTVQPLLPAMMQRRRGQIAIMSSLSAFVPLPDSPSYSASKSAVLTYGLSLRTLLAPYGIGVSVICPGYVATPMTVRESGDKPFEMPVERAVGFIDAGLRRNKAVIAFPFAFALATRMHGLLPDWLSRRLLLRSRFTIAD